MLKLEVSYRGLILIGLALLSLWALLQLWPIILLIITAFIFMAALLPYVDWLVRHGIRRTQAVLLLVLAIVLVLVGMIALLVPALIDEFSNIEERLPQDAREAEKFLDNFGLDVELEERSRDIDWGELISGREAFDYTQRVFAVILSVFTIVVITVYLLIDTPRLSKFMYQFVPPGREPEVDTILQQLNRVVGGYIRGQIITSACIGVYTLIVLLALGVDNAIAFAVLAAFVDIIPIFGAIAATVMPTVAAFHDSPTRAVIVLALLVLYQQFEDRFLVPRVYGQTLNLPPIVVLIAVLAGGQLLGIPGVLLALPAAAVGRVALEYYLDHRRGSLGPPGPTSEPLAPDSQ